MSRDDERKSEILPMELLERVERICKDFEGAWKCGEFGSNMGILPLEPPGVQRNSS